MVDFTEIFHRKVIYEILYDLMLNEFGTYSAMSADQLIAEISKRAPNLKHHIIVLEIKSLEWVA